MSNWLISVLSPWFVTVCGLVVLVIGVWQGLTRVRLFSKGSFFFVFGVIVLVLVGGWLRFQSPNQHRIYFDEDRYLSPAVTFAKYGDARLINLATNERLLLGDPDLVARVTVPTVNSWVLKLFGYSENNLILVSRVLSTFQIVLIVIAVCLYLRSRLIAIIAAGIFAFSPVPIFWSLSIGLDSYFVFFGLLAFIGAVWYGRDPRFTSWLFLTATTILMLFVRLEAFLFLSVQLLAIIGIRKHFGKAILTAQDIRYGLLTGVFIGIRGLVSVSVLGQTWCCGEATPLEAFGFGYVIRNTVPNIVSMFKRPEWPAVLTVFGLLGTLIIKDVRKWSFIAWYSCYFLIYSFYFAGEFFSVEYSGSYGRYFLMLVVPLIILAVWYGYQIYQTYVSNPRLKSFFIVLTLIVMVSLVPTVTRYQRMITVSPYDHYVDKGPRDVHTYIEDVVLQRVPQDAVLIHAMTAVTVLHGRTAVYYGSFLYNTAVQDFVAEQITAGKEVYMLQTYTCDVYPDKCMEITDRFIFRPAPNLNAMELSMVRVLLKE